MAEQLKQEELISENEQKAVLARSFMMKEVITLPPGWVIVNCDNKNKPLEVFASKKLPPFRLISSSIFVAEATIGAALLEHGKSRYVAWNNFYPNLLVVKSREEDEAVLTRVPFRDFAPSHEWFASADEKEIVDYISSIFNKAEVLKHENALHQTWGNPVPTWGLIKNFGEDKHKPAFRIWKPVVVVQKEHLSLHMPIDSDYDFLLDRLPKEKQDQNRQGNMAMLSVAVSAQNILSFMGGSRAMNIPESIFFCTLAANAIAFVSSSVALLLLKKKPYAARNFEVLGFASAIATFSLMMSAFLPLK